MIGPNVESTRAAAFRMNVVGTWSVEELCGLLSTVADGYNRVATVMMLGDLIESEASHNAALEGVDSYEEGVDSFEQPE